MNFGMCVSYSDMRTFDQSRIPISEANKYKLPLVLHKLCMQRCFAVQLSWRWSSCLPVPLWSSLNGTPMPKAKSILLQLALPPHLVNAFFFSFFFVVINYCVLWTKCIANPYSQTTVKSRSTTTTTTQRTWTEGDIVSELCCSVGVQHAICVRHWYLPSRSDKHFSL